MHVDENVIEVYIPRALPKTKHAVLYLPDATGEQAPINAFRGNEIVCAPQFTNYDGNGKAWRNVVPDWLPKWVAEAQGRGVRCRWGIFGNNRGGAWGAILAADGRLTFHRVLLVAPYILPSCSVSDRQPPATD